jgi:TRAP-type uncharacterized transport system fused permease subunit
MVPVAFVLVTLDALRRGALYPRLGRVQYILGGIYVVAAAAAGSYLFREFDAIRRVRVGFWSDADLLAGGVMVLLILEYTRRRYMPLFVINLLLVLYTVYGYVVPGMFRHPGLPWERVVSALSVEMATGIFERLPQLALTLIGSFVLVLADEHEDPTVLRRGYSPEEARLRRSLWDRSVANDRCADRSGKSGFLRSGVPQFVET